MARRLAEVIDSHPGVSLLPMGFPDDWKKIIGVDRDENCNLEEKTPRD